MEFSVWPDFTRSWDDLVAFARAAEERGWYGLWYPDHYMGDTADGAPSDVPALECWTALAAVAASTTRLRLGSLVSPTTMHHPALLAKQAATVDRISGGRLTLGLGAGWQVNEHAAYGVDLRSPRDRVDRFAEAIEIVHGLLTEPRTTVRGAHFTVVEAPCEPKPVQHPMRLLVGSAGTRMAGLVARYATDWNMWGIPDVVAAGMATVDRACEEAGRDPATLRRTAQAMVFLADTADDAERYRQRARPDRSLIGAPEQIADQLRRYVDLGISEFIVPDFNLGRTLEERLARYERLEAEVLPLV